MSRIRKNIEYYRTPEEVEVDIGSDNVPEKFNNANLLVGDVIFYVETVANSGSDTTGDGTSGAPFETINKALLVVKDYIISSNATFTVSVGPGEWIVNSTIDIDVSQGDGVFITGTKLPDTTMTAILGIGPEVPAVPPMELGYYDITLQLADNTGIEAGDHLMISGLDIAHVETAEGTAALNGTWEVVYVGVSNQVDIRFDHFYTYWDVDTLLGDQNYVPVSGWTWKVPTTSSLEGHVRVIKTRLLGNFLGTIMYIPSGYKANINNLSFEHNVFGVTGTGGSNHGLIIDDGAYCALGENMSFRKCNRGVNTHSGSSCDVRVGTNEKGCTGSTNFTSFYTNIGSSMYLSTNIASNSYQGYNVALLSVLISSGVGIPVLRAYNCRTGLNVGGSSNISVGTFLGRYCGYGLVASTSATCGISIANLNYNTYGASVSYAATLIISNTSINHNTIGGILAKMNSTVRCYNYDYGSNGTYEFNLDSVPGQTDVLAAVDEVLGNWGTIMEIREPV